MVVGGEAEDLHGRDEVVAALYYRHRDDLVRLAAGMTGDAGLAEEIVHEAFAQLLARWALLRDLQAAPAYLRQIVVHGARASWRRRRRRELVAHLLGSQAHTEGPDLAHQSTLLAALGHLPLATRPSLPPPPSATPPAAHTA